MGRDYNDFGSLAGGEYPYRKSLTGSTQSSCVFKSLVRQQDFVEVFGDYDWVVGEVVYPGQSGGCGTLQRRQHVAQSNSHGLWLRGLVDGKLGNRRLDKVSLGGGFIAEIRVIARGVIQAYHAKNWLVHRQITL